MVKLIWSSFWFQFNKRQSLLQTLVFSLIVVLVSKFITMLCWKDSQNYNQSGEVTQAEVKPVKKKLKLGNSQVIEKNPAEDLIIQACSGSIVTKKSLLLATSVFSKEFSKINSPFFKYEKIYRFLSVYRR